MKQVKRKSTYYYKDSSRLDRHRHRQILDLSLVTVKNKGHTRLSHYYNVRRRTPSSVLNVTQITTSFTHLTYLPKMPLARCWWKRTDVFQLCRSVPRLLLDSAVHRLKLGSHQVPARYPTDGHSSRSDVTSVWYPSCHGTSVHRKNNTDIKFRFQCPSCGLSAWSALRCHVVCIIYRTTVRLLGRVSSSLTTVQCSSDEQNCKPHSCGNQKCSSFIIFAKCWIVQLLHSTDIVQQT